MSIILNKPKLECYPVNNLNGSLFGAINKNSEYIPLFDLLPKIETNNKVVMKRTFSYYDYGMKRTFSYYDYDLYSQLNEPYFNQLNSIDSKINYYKRSIIQNNSININSFNKSLFELNRIKIDSWILNNPYLEKSYNNVIKMEYSRKYITEWFEYFDCFNNGRVSSALSALSTESTFVNYGFISKYNFDSINGKIGDILVQLVCKRDYVPFIRANWMIDFPILSNMVEMWVLSDIDKPSYPNQILRKKIKENVINGCYKDFIVFKSKEEMQSVFYYPNEPKFSTLTERKKWIDERISSFIQYERKKLNVKVEKKKMFNFTPVKTKL